MRRAGEVAAFEVREALELEVLPRAACFDAREGILYVIDGRSHALWCAALDVADGEPLRSSTFVRALEGVGSRLLADRGGVEAGLVSIRLEEDDAARLRLVHAARSFSESHPHWPGGRRALPAPSREARWRIEASAQHEIATLGFWVRGPRGSFEVLEMPSQRVIGRGAIAEERAFFAGEGQLVSGLAYAVRGAGAARSAAIVARSRVGEPRGTEELEIGRVQMRRRATRAGKQLWFTAGLRCAHASRSEREALVWLALSAAAPETSPVPLVDASTILLGADFVRSRILRVEAGRQTLRGLELGAWPAWMASGGVELHAQVAGWLEGEREVAFSDVLGFRIE
ncbi:MAG: hypothetical protein IPN34_15215 [Planctomycetes bacterium]|nr:hypothetical protein [Planctomycetota bacterium]